MKSIALLALFVTALLPQIISAQDLMTITGTDGRDFVRENGKWHKTDFVNNVIVTFSFDDKRVVFESEEAQLSYWIISEVWDGGAVDHYLLTLTEQSDEIDAQLSFEENEFSLYTERETPGMSFRKRTQWHFE